MASRVPIIVVGICIVLGTALYFMLNSDTRPAPASHATPSPATAAAKPAAPTPTPATPPTSEPAKAKASAPKVTAPLPAPVPTAATADAPTMGSIHVMADVAEASVFIDRKFIGTAPVTANDITPGQHRLNVSAPGYDGYVEDLDVTAGPRELSIKFKEIRLAASIAVVHKHAMGSCAGILKATPQGLTYETSNKDDGFAVTLTGIDTFEVDYLKKNLKVKLKTGKTYNFTDPDGNADRLFAFHRDVDKVRQRLIAGGI